MIGNPSKYITQISLFNFSLEFAFMMNQRWLQQQQQQRWCSVERMGSRQETDFNRVLGKIFSLRQQQQRGQSVIQSRCLPIT